MKHSHHDHCEHEEVAYCGHCQVVYCRGCKREWSDCKLSHSPYTYTFPYTCGICNCTPCVCSTTVTFTDGTAGISSDTISESTGAAGVTVNEVKFVPTACSHA